jgi:hypothetical protein
VNLRNPNSICQKYLPIFAAERNMTAVLMADDTMEISSENGHNGGDDDIDIDIEFTAGDGVGDEDYVLGDADAASDIDFEDGPNTHGPSVVGHDDLMVDEDEDTYVMEDTMVDDANLDQGMIEQDGTGSLILAPDMREGQDQIESAANLLPVSTTATLHDIGQSLNEESEMLSMDDGSFLANAANYSHDDQTIPSDQPTDSFSAPNTLQGEPVTYSGIDALPVPYVEASNDPPMNTSTLTEALNEGQIGGNADSSTHNHLDGPSAVSQDGVSHSAPSTAEVELDADRKVSLHDTSKHMGNTSQQANDTSSQSDPISSVAILPEGHDELYAAEAKVTSGADIHGTGDEGDLEETPLPPNSNPEHSRKEASYEAQATRAQNVQQRKSSSPEASTSPSVERKASPGSDTESEPGYQPTSPGPDPNLTSKDANVLSGNGATVEASIPEVTMVWKEQEYAVFSMSELDDPDTYFLSDTSTLDQPLGAFFEAIREVICDELKEDEELCMVVDNLGLEIEEVSFPTDFGALKYTNGSRHVPSFKILPSGKYSTHTILY